MEDTEGSPLKPSPGKRLNAGLNTGANGVASLLDKRDRKKHWSQTFRNPDPRRPEIPATVLEQSRDYILNNNTGGA